jgi:hypothetical protein
MPVKSIVGKLIEVAQGKTTAWLAAFFVIGNVLAYVDKLSSTYVAFMAMFMSIVLGHSIKEDYFKQDPPASTPTPG